MSRNPALPAWSDCWPSRVVVCVERLCLFHKVGNTLNSTFSSSVIKVLRVCIKCVRSIVLSPSGVFWYFFMLVFHCFVVVQSLSCIPLFVPSWTAACQTSLSFTVSQSMLKLMSIESVMLSSHLILCRPLLLLLSIFPSIRVFSSESALPIRWPKYWSFSFSISPSNDYSGLISFRIDWFDLLTVQGTHCFEEN